MNSTRASLAVAACLSLASGMVGHGIYFLARQAYHFDDAQNLWLAMVLFAPYVPGALLAGPVTSRFGRRLTMVLVTLVMIGCGLILAMKPPVLALWICAPLYNGCAGMLWPLIEAGVSQGRSGRELQKAVGSFNLTWAITLIPGLWVVAWAGERLAWVFGVLIVFHLLSLLFVPKMGGAHHSGEAEKSPADYRVQLRVARMLMPMAYLFLYTLAPLLPGIWAGLGLEGGWGAALTPTWMGARVLVFAGMIGSTRWQGRWSVLVAGSALLLGGMAGVLLGGSVPVVLLSLLAFGTGHALVYYAALYYGMVVGQGGVEAGGWHEASIGLGYLAGPLLSVVGLQLDTGPLPVVATVGLIVMAGGVLVSRVPVTDTTPH